MAKRSRLLTSKAQNDRAIGMLVGFLSTLYLAGSAMGLAEHFPSSAAKGKPNVTLPLLFDSLPVLLVWMIFFFLRWCLPDFARGYCFGALVFAVFLGIAYFGQFLP
jgi:hypothetical protein